MEIKVSLEKGILPVNYSKFAPNQYRINGKPACSFPIKILNKPQATKTFAIYFKDFDSVPVCGFVWIHWLVANIPSTMIDIPENLSQNPTDTIVQGYNSNVSKFLPKDSGPIIGYTGPQPPSGIHNYELTVYALDNELNLKNGFYLNEFLDKIKGHILAEAKLDIPSSATM